MERDTEVALFGYLLQVKAQIETQVASNECIESAWVASAVASASLKQNNISTHKWDTLV